MVVDDGAERRLTAILAADVVGFSRLVSADEEGILAQLRILRHDLIDLVIDQYRGRVFKTMGDGFLVEFVSIVEATRCALELQRAFKQHNVEIPADKRIEFRIGINLCDVVVEGSDILGDGVNVAARLEGIADPGGVLVSEDAYRHMRGKIAANFTDLGERELKNIPNPVRVFSVAARPENETMSAPRSQFLSFPGKASIAVLPFQNLAGETDQEYFADAISEDITIALCRWRWFFVIARDSSFIYKNKNVDVKRVGRELGVRYLVQGSVRKVGNRVRIGAQLIDTQSAAHVWADSFDRDLNDLFAVQDEITQQVVSAIEPEMQRHESFLITQRNPRDLSALDCYQRGMWHFNKMSPDGYGEAQSLFRQSIARDSELSLGHIGLARTLYAGVAYGWSERPDESLEEAREAAQTAIGIDGRDAYGHFALSGTLLYLGHHQESLDETNTTISLNPNFALGHYRFGQALVYSGRPADAIAPIERSMRHSPYDPQLGGILALLALAHYHLGQYTEAIRHASVAVRLKSNRGTGVLAASLAQMERKQEAQEALASLSSSYQMRVANGTLRLVPYANRGDQDHFLQGLHLAGLDLVLPKS